jgi:hypothetical protein
MPAGKLKAEADEEVAESLTYYVSGLSVYSEWKLPCNITKPLGGLKAQGGFLWQRTRPEVLNEYCIMAVESGGDVRGADAVWASNADARGGGRS